MPCELTEDQNVWLPTSLINLAQDSVLEYLKASVRPRSQFYVGTDFGKHQDYSVVAVIERLRGHLYLRHYHQFPLETSYGAVIGYMNLIQDSWRTVWAVYANKTGFGDYIVEDMVRGGIRNVTGINFTDASKESIATALKEKIRNSVCPSYGWEGYVDTLEGEWRTTCPRGCRSEEGNSLKLRPLLYLPYDPDLIRELNAERFELGNTGKLQFNHPEGTHDDRF
jgi:hypothetical protein